MTLDPIDRLRAAIHRLHGCDARQVESAPVLDSYRGEVVWQGAVDVFELTGHPGASRCYAKGQGHNDRDDSRTKVELPLRLSAFGQGTSNATVCTTSILLTPCPSAGSQNFMRG